MFATSLLIFDTDQNMAQIITIVRPKENVYLFHKPTRNFEKKNMFPFKLTTLIACSIVRFICTKVEIICRA